MSDSVQSFALILNQQNKKKPSPLYCDIMNQNQSSFKPQDVISSVSSQLKAIQNADSTKSEKRTINDLKMYQNLMFTSVNDLSVIDKEPRKQGTKFDIQTITDTQLINVIEDAEVLEAHRGMTQEFETAFLHDNTELISDKQVGISDTKIVTQTNNLDSIIKDTIYNETISEVKDKLVTNTQNASDKNTLIHYSIDLCDNNDSDNFHHKLNENMLKNLSNKVDYTRFDTEINLNNITENHDIEVEQLSQVLVTKTANFRRKKCGTQTISHKNYNKDEHSSEIEKYSQFNYSKETNHDSHNIEKPPSPIFENKYLNIKLKSPSPLVFNLDQFEHFESIAMSLLESADFNNGNHVLNSQLLHKEFHFNVNKEMESNIVSLAIDDEVSKPKQCTTPMPDKVKEFIKMDNTNSEENFQENATNTSNIDKNIFKDEILFSSDEEENNIHKKYQDLPFTCALETCIYNQSEVLDKTVYVGFQTASNRSIQVGADSFTRAKSILNDVTSDGLTVTQLVNNCDSSVTDTITIDMNIEGSSLYLAPINQPSTRKGFLGFKTANNKKIKLSKEALARCKKVFQDIDLDEKFDNVNNKEHLQQKDQDEEDENNKSKCHSNDAEKGIIKNNMVPINNIIGFDEEIVQEFENIEMSLEDLKVDKKSVSVPVESLNHDSLTTYEIPFQVEEDIVRDIAFLEDINENITKENKNTENIIVSQGFGSGNKDQTNMNVDSKISRNKHINIAEKCRVPGSINNMNDNLSKIIKDDDCKRKKFVYLSTDAGKQTSRKFKDCGEAIPKPKSNSEKYEYSSEVNINQPSTSKGFLGFKTANNKNIKISEKAWGKSKDLFNNIDSTELPKTGNKKYPCDIAKNQCYHIPEGAVCKKPYTEIPLLGFKTASNKNIQICDESLANTGSIFNDISLNDLVSSKLEECPHVKDPESRKQLGESKLPESPVGLVSFKSASNKLIKISEHAIAQTSSIFKDIDLEFSKAPFLENKKDQEVTESQICKQKQGGLISTEHKFFGFKTANNKNIHISKGALAKTKDIFKDIDSSEFIVPSTTKKSCPGFEDNHITKDSDQSNKVENNEPIYHYVRSILNPDLKESLQVQQSQHYPSAGNEIFQEDLHSENISNQDSIDAKPPSPVFNESSAHKDPIFEKCLEKNKAKAMFADIDFKKSGCILGNTGLVGFHTASNKQVKISEKAFAKCRKLFKDFDNHDDLNVQSENIKGKSLYPQEILQENLEVIEGSNILPGNKSVFKETSFKGFQTASEKPVAVSTSALEKSKKLLKDLDEVNFEPIKCYGVKKNNSAVKHRLNFKGFETASYQKVNISQESLAKAKKLFNDLNIQNNEEQATVDPSSFNIGFQTGNNKTIAVSEEASAKSKRLFSEIEDECNRNKDSKIHKNEDVAAILDTQVLNNFEKSLYTEDFIISPKKPKRSGSPILLCPRAKKRKKFEVPYNLKQIPKPTIKPIEKCTVKDNDYCYREEYKKEMIYKLKDLDNMSKNVYKQIDPFLCNLDHEKLLQFEFNPNRNDLSSDNISIDLLKQIFLNSVNAKLIPNGWIDNHLQLILWKLISYEVKFKSLIVCTARNVLEQLKYRYEKELYKAQRPALRKIFEKDDVPSKTMVLCVVGIYVDDVIVSSVTRTSSNIELLLTDGWYNIRCKIDKMLTNIVCSGKIRAGSKIATSGAELLGCEQGVSPWEDTSAIRLKISGNSTRLAKWDARLGYHNGIILSHLSSIQVLGGKVSKLRVLVTRVYPALYVEKFDDGSTVTRSERLENIHQMKTEAERQVFMEKLYEEVEKEFVDQESQDSESPSDSCKRTCLDSGSQISKMIKKSKDPGEFRAQLTDSQLRLLESHTSKNRDRLLQDIQARIRDRIEKAGVSINRNVVSLLKIRVAGVIEKEDNVEVSKGMISIWKPNDAIQEVIKEGAWIDLLNVIPTAVRYSEIQISASRQSIFSASKYKEPDKFKPYTKLLQRHWYSIKDLAQNPSMTTDYNEIDTVGLIFSIDPSIKEFESTKQPFQNVYLADVDKKIICANFWGGLQKFGYQNVLDTGQVVACVNLQKRAGNTRKSIPQFRVTEFSYFTQTPKNIIAKSMLEDFNKKLNVLDRRKFCQDCEVLKNRFSFTKNNENISPYRCVSTDINMSKNKMFSDSPLIRPNKIDDNFNLTGLDFESTFKQDTQLSEEMLKRKKKVNEKIARLKMYGEPPPLSPINMINKSKVACSSYKSPLISSDNNSNIINSNSKSFNENSKLKRVNYICKESDSSVNVARGENTPQKCLVQPTISTSPVLLNKTYVKSVNPVKINFDIQENYDGNIDHFAEEFDGSPPLSLD